MSPVALSPSDRGRRLRSWLSRVLSPSRCVRILLADHAVVHKSRSRFLVFGYSFGVWAVTMFPVALGLVPSGLSVAMVLVCLVLLWGSPWSVAMSAGSWVTRRVRWGLYSSDPSSQSWALGVLAALLCSSMASYVIWGLLSYEFRLAAPEDHDSRDVWLSRVVGGLRDPGDDALGAPSEELIASRLRTVFTSPFAADVLAIAESVVGATVFSTTWPVLDGAASLVPVFSVSDTHAELVRRLAASWSGSCSDLSDAVRVLALGSSSISDGSS